MKNKKNRKKKLAIATIVATLLLIAAGTYAFTAYTEWVKNHFQSSGMEEGKVTIVEDFTPPFDLAPNGEYKKYVSAKNTGAGKYLVRMSFEEGSSRLGLTTDGAALAADKSNATKIVQASTPGPVSGYFPVILNSATFTADNYTFPDSSAAANSVAKNAADFTIKDAANTNPSLKLLVLKSDTTNSSAILVNEVKVTKADFPGEDFVLTQITDTSGNPLSFANDTEEKTVYQKVGINNGDIVRNSSSGKYDITGDVVYYQFNTTFRTQKSNQTGTWTSKHIMVADTTQAGKLAAADITTDGNYKVANSKIDPQVQFKFNKDLNSDFGTLTVPAAASNLVKGWAYNPADGYFYYLDVLNSEQETVSLLEKVKFGDSDVNLLSSYNLYVGLEAIPADLEALTLVGDDTIDKDAVTPSGNPQTWTFKTGNGWGLTTATQKNVIDYYTQVIGLN